MAEPTARLPAQVAPLPLPGLGCLRSVTASIGARMQLPPAASKARSGDAVKPMPVEACQPLSSPLELVKSVLESVLKPFESALNIFIVAVFSDNREARA